MDPIANLKEQLDLAQSIQVIWEDCDDDTGELSANQRKAVAGMADRLSELVLALDEWQRKGGFSPYAQAVSK